MKLVQRNKYLDCTVATDGLVLKDQRSSNQSADYTPMHCQVFMS